MELMISTQTKMVRNRCGMIGVENSIKLKASLRFNRIVLKWKTATENLQQSKVLTDHAERRC